MRRRLLQPGEQIGVPRQERILHRQVIEDVAHNVRVAGLFDHGYRAVIDGHNRDEILSYGYAREERLDQVACAYTPALLAFGAGIDKCMLGETSITTNRCRISLSGISSSAL